MASTTSTTTTAAAKQGTPEWHSEGGSERAKKALRTSSGEEGEEDAEKCPDPDCWGCVNLETHLLGSMSKSIVIDLMMDHLAKYETKLCVADLADDIAKIYHRMVVHQAAVHGWPCMKFDAGDVLKHLQCHPRRAKAPAPAPAVKAPAPTEDKAPAPAKEEEEEEPACWLCKNQPPRRKYGQPYDPVVSMFEYMHQFVNSTSHDRLAGYVAEMYESSVYMPGIKGGSKPEMVRKADVLRHLKHYDRMATPAPAKAPEPVPVHTPKPAPAPAPAPLTKAQILSANGMFDSLVVAEFLQGQGRTSDTSIRVLLVVINPWAGFGITGGAKGADHAIMSVDPGRSILIGADCATSDPSDARVEVNLYIKHIRRLRSMNGFESVKIIAKIVSGTEQHASDLKAKLLESFTSNFVVVTDCMDKSVLEHTKAQRKRMWCVTNTMLCMKLVALHSTFFQAGDVAVLKPLRAQLTEPTLGGGKRTDLSETFQLAMCHSRDFVMDDSWDV